MLAGTGLGIALTLLAVWNGGFGASTSGGDLHGIFVAKFRWITERLRAGDFPLWNPYEYCGLPLYALAHGAVLYLPVTLANLLWPPHAALQAIYGAHLALYATVLARLLASARVGLGAAVPAAALAGSSVFVGRALGGMDHPNYLLEACWVPALLLAADGVRAGRRGAAVALAAIAAVQWLPGYPEIPMVTPLLVVLVTAWLAAPRLVPPVAVGLLFGLGGLLAAVQLLPVMESVGESQRVADAGRFDQLRAIFAVPSPAALVGDNVTRYGAAGVFAVLVGLTVPGRRTAAWAACLTWCVFATNRPFVWLYALWPWSGIRFAFGWDAVTTVFVGLLAGLGLQRLRAAPSWAAAAFGAGLALALVALGRWTDAAVALACGAAALGVAGTRGAVLVPTALLALHVATVMLRIGTAGPFPPPDLAALAPRVDALRALRERFPERPRIAASPELRAGLLLPERLPSVTGHEPAQPPRRIHRLGEHLGLDAMIWGAEAWRDTARRLAAAPGTAAALGLGLVALPPTLVAPLVDAGWREVARLPDGDVVLYRSSPPRFRVVHAVQPARDEEDAFALVTAPGFDPASRVVLEGADAAAAAAVVGPRPPDGVDAVTVRRDEPEHVALTVSATAPGVLVVADTFYPGWEAWVDGRRDVLLRADYALRGLLVPAGTHEVEIVYRPRSLATGAAVSAGALAVLALIGFAPRRR